MADEPRRPRAITAARVVGGLAAAMWAVPLVGAIVGGDDPGDAGLVEVVGVVGLALTNIVGVLVAVRHPAFGGRWLLASGSAFALFALVTAGRNQWLAVGVSGAPFVLAGALFLVGARRTDRRRREDGAACSEAATGS